MNAPILLDKLLANQTLSISDAEMLMNDIVEQNLNPFQISSVLTILSYRSVTADEILGFRNVLSSKAKAIDIPYDDYIDIVGTGGDNKNTFNISTLASFVVAGAGYKVVKHGNYASSSVSGSSDVLEYFGYRFSNDKNKILKELERYNITFLHAPMFHPSLKPLAPIRKGLGFRTIFNLLGPLLNPSKPPYSFLGVSSHKIFELYKGMMKLNNQKYSIVFSNDGYDEISLTGDFLFSYLGKEKTFSPSDIHFNKILPKDIFGGDSKEESAKLFKHILECKTSSACENVVIANAAFAIYTLKERQLDIMQCIDIARESLVSKQALTVFLKIMDMQHG